jgi:hypothetical protein
MKARRTTAPDDFARGEPPKLRADLYSAAWYAKQLQIEGEYFESITAADRKRMRNIADRLDDAAQALKDILKLPSRMKDELNRLYETGDRTHVRRAVYDTKDELLALSPLLRALATDPTKKRGRGQRKAEPLSHRLDRLRTVLQAHSIDIATPRALDLAVEFARVAWPDSEYTRDHVRRALRPQGLNTI